MQAARRVLSVAIVLAILASLVGALVVVAPFMLAKRRVRLAIRAARDAPDAERLGKAHALLDYPGPEPIVALVDLYQRRPSGRAWGYPTTRWRYLVRTDVMARIGVADLREELPLVEAVELAAPEGVSPIVRVTLERLAASESIDDRFTARYLLAELDAPTFPAEPAGFASIAELELAPGTATVDELLGRLGAATSAKLEARGLGTRSIRLGGADAPWRFLLRIAQQLGARVEVQPGKVSLVGSPLPMTPLTHQSFRAEVADLPVLLEVVSPVAPSGDPLETLELLAAPRRVRLGPGVKLAPFPAVVFGRPEKALVALADVLGVELVELPGGDVEIRRRRP